jgi:ubiquinone/menaquinone biosynthesis C-methylase UbiE
MSWLSAAALLSAALLVPAAASGQSLSAQQIFEAIGVRDGAVVCEIGAGDGALSLEAARSVGPDGRVYTSELGDRRVTTLQEKVAASGLAHITVVAGDATGTNFPDAACDALFMRDVYHHLTDPAAMNASIVRALKPGARAAVVDFAPPGAEAAGAADRGRDGMHGVGADTVLREMQEAGLEPVSTERPAQRWFMVVVRKPIR